MVFSLYSSNILKFENYNILNGDLELFIIFYMKLAELHITHGKMFSVKVSISNYKKPKQYRPVSFSFFGWVRI